ncbi:Trafficking protein particle complex subunit [Pelomyxa schiedti]|nr:Trafficking protein particle complex subunit [Pelomyxa schiedti]
MSSVVACVAVVGKNNNPLYIRAFKEQEDKLKFHYIVHTSLDVVEEKLSTTPSTGSGGKNDAPSSYLGLLFPTEEHKVYGYITCTKNKFIAVIDDIDIKDNQMKAFFKQFHSIFADAMCTPFQTSDKRITSKRFELEVEKACATLHSTNKS